VDYPLGVVMDRKCKSCGEVKSEDQFSPKKYRCKPCRSSAESQRQKLARWKRSANVTEPLDVPKEGHYVKGTSTLVDMVTGKAKLQWIKTNKDQEAITRELSESIVRTLESSGIAPLPSVTPMSGVKDPTSLTVYPIGDHHFGMLAWAQESGDDYNLKLGEEYLSTAIDQLVSVCPPTERAIVAILGDFVHADNAAGTTTSGTRLDTDSRFGKITDVAMRSAIRSVERALENHQRVDLVVVPGNHDSNVAVMLGAAMKYTFRDNDRVTVSDAWRTMHFYEFGQNLLGFYHGHTCKLKDLPLLMATDVPDLWGRTSFRTWFTGHLHHRLVEEYNGCTVEIARVLPGKDAWHAAQGYRALQEMQAIVYDRDEGEVARYTIGIRKIKNILGK